MNRSFSFFDRWSTGDQMSAMQSQLAETLSPLSAQEALVDEGHQVLEAFVQQGKRQQAALSKVFHFRELMSAPWPIKLLGHMHDQLPAEFRRALKKCKVGLLASNDINASAWPRDKSVGIFIGLPSFVQCCFVATSTTDPATSAETPSPALQLATLARDLSQDFLFCSDAALQQKLFARIIIIRSTLGREYPVARPLLERPAAAQSNDVCRFVFLHEVAHIVLKHKGRVGWESQQQEWDADALALRALLHDQMTYPWCAALAMSVLEMAERINGRPVGYFSDTHPPTFQRRGELLESAIEQTARSGLREAEMMLALHVTHMAHARLSGLLVSRGCDPLLPFFTSLAFQHIRPSRLPAYPPDVPEKVRQLENHPFTVAGVTR